MAGFAWNPNVFGDGAARLAMLKERVKMRSSRKRAAANGDVDAIYVHFHGCVWQKVT